MKIITISREFGSGGRELGKRLADLLGYDYYDREIITAIAEKKGLDENYVENELENSSWRAVPLTYRHSFTSPFVLQPQTDLLLEQTKIIEEIPTLGRDFVIVGRNADVLLEKYAPFNLFVCADMESKVRRCIERAESDEKLSRKDIEHNIRRIDKNRARTREIISDSVWGDRANYRLTVNTSDWQIKDLAPAVADFAKRWLGRSE